MDAKQKKKVENVLVHLKLAVSLEKGVYYSVMSYKNIRKEMAQKLKSAEQTPEIKKVRDYIENALLSESHLTYQDLMSRENIKEVVMPLLEKSIQWNGNNDEIFNPIAQEFKNAVEKGGISETAKKVSAFWKVGSIAAIFIGAASAKLAINHFHKKKSAKK